MTDPPGLRPVVIRPEAESDIVVFRVLHSARHDREWKSNVPKE